MSSDMATLSVLIRNCLNEFQFKINSELVERLAEMPGTIVSFFVFFVTCSEKRKRRL